MRFTHTPPSNQTIPTRLVPDDWLQRRAGQRAQPRRSAPSNSRKWLTTFPTALAEVREAALEALAAMPAEIAYLYEADNKVVIRATQPHRQIRAELTPLEPGSTRVVVACMHDENVDRETSSRVIRGMEEILDAVPSTSHSQ